LIFYPPASTDIKHLEYFIAIVVDHLDRNFTSGWRIKVSALGGVQFGPSGFINVGPQRPL
jgi:hypothetical protein